MRENYDEVETTNQYNEQSTFAESYLPKSREVESISSIIDEIESRLAIGQVVKSVEDAYFLYYDYAHAKGFSIRKGDQHYFPCSNELQAKEFEYSCGEMGEWKVTRFVMEHNHEMVESDQTYLLRSSRNLSNAQKSTFEAMVNARISLASVVSYMEEKAHGPENLRFTRKDAYDYIRSLKKHTKVENGDASELIKYFLNKSNNEPCFYWDVQLDDDNRVMNFFFRDYRCRIDYESFGDMLSVDTTYRTNRYNLICAPFVGINHHKQNVMFGLAFMSDETEESFEWLFRTFLESMSGKQPETLLQINVKLCQWHINQNAPSHLGNLNCDSRFKQLWNKCMTYCDSEEEFEETWKHMIHEYDLSHHKWLNGMYKLRYKWATAFSNTRFSAGLLAKSRSEGTNSVLKKAGNRTISLCDFVLNYEKIQKTWRVNEKTEDTRCRHGKPPMIVKNHPLLIHVADVYTMNLYKLFEIELIESLSIEFAEDLSFFGPFFILFKVKSLNQYSRIKNVWLDKQKNEVKCSCHKFESMGILCKHALKVINHVKVHSIPEPYIKKRCMKNIRNRVSDIGSKSESGSGSQNETCRASEMVFVNHSMRSFYDIIVQCKHHEEARNMLTKIPHDAREKTTALLENLSLNDLHACDDVVVDEDNCWSNEILVRDPFSVKSRGITNARIPPHWDEQSRKGKGKGRSESSSDKLGVLGT
ncbi:hypothetical protein CDL12_16027 [Handroanthus impetiginosus]|uniref:SWIM-type domain-containing protein n=1 Tax=Handroanthus impetiginosus TaxID=429701 RepID=A0A2G9H1H1_9LAMI|nr:hypothetical protein CDL12_16027 [Handroanthus impetiginosus]